MALYNVTTTTRCFQKYTSFIFTITAANVGRFSYFHW